MKLSDQLAIYQSTIYLKILLSLFLLCCRIEGIYSVVVVSMCLCRVCGFDWFWSRYAKLLHIGTLNSMKMRKECAKPIQMNYAGLIRKKAKSHWHTQNCLNMLSLVFVINIAKAIVCVFVSRTRRFCVETNS